MELVLGSANLGLSYGRALYREIPDKEFALSILERAVSRGLVAIDTAPAYGCSEKRIGEFLSHGSAATDAIRVSTKSDPTLHFASGNLTDATLSSVSQSLHRLGRSTISQVLLHRWEQYNVADGTVWNALKSLREKGVIERIGVSVQSPEELRMALECTDIETIQLACNILDWRYEGAGLDVLLGDASARIEVRSVFLQGLLGLSPNVKFPSVSEPYSEVKIRNFLVEAADTFTGGDVIALNLRYALSLLWADALVIGSDSPSEVDSLFDIVDNGALPMEAIQELQARRPRVPESFLDPAKWH